MPRVCFSSAGEVGAAVVAAFLDLWISLGSSQASKQGTWDSWGLDLFQKLRGKERQGKSKRENRLFPHHYFAIQLSSYLYSYILPAYKLTSNCNIEKDKTPTTSATTTLLLPPPLLLLLLGNECFFSFSVSPSNKKFRCHCSLSLLVPFSNIQ